MVHNEKYWDPSGSHYDIDPDDKKQVERKCKELMLQSVKRRLVSDVPVGAFLSGGIDSSAIVGLMVEAGEPSPKTFTISFDETEFDESRFAETVAKKFHAEHTCYSFETGSHAGGTDPCTGCHGYSNGRRDQQLCGFQSNSWPVASGLHFRVWAVMNYLPVIRYFEIICGFGKRDWIWKMPLAIRKMAGGFLGKGSKKDRMRQLIGMPSPGIENSYPVFRQILSPDALRELTSLNGAGQMTFSRQMQFEKKGIVQRCPCISQVTAAEYLGYYPKYAVEGYRPDEYGTFPGNQGAFF